MSDSSVIIAKSIRYLPSAYAFDIWMQQTFRRVDLGQLLIYFIDKVNANVLPILAQEFNVLGNKGWNFCADEVAQRAFLKQCPQWWLHAGTPWVLGQCMEVLCGFIKGSYSIEECSGSVGDGCDWARFSVNIYSSVMLPTSVQTTNATVLINEWKRKGSVFTGFVTV